jgi:hypothetical protein
MLDDYAQEYLDGVVERVKQGMRQSGSIGIIVGILVSREVLHRSGIDPATVAVLNDANLIPLLKKVATGDIILQDQVLSGQVYNPEIEQAFQEYAKEFIKKYESLH